MDNSGVNTIILVLIFALVAFGIVWFVKGNQAEQQDGLNVEVSLPSGGGEGGSGGSE